MKSSILLCLFATTKAFAPIAQKSSQPSSLVPNKLSLNDFSLVISDAADAVVDAVDTLTTVDAATTSSAAVIEPVTAAAASSVAEPSGFNPTYSKASYYTTLALYVASFPGLWSQVKRSTKAKVKRKTYVSDGEMAEGGGKELRQQAGEIMACEFEC